MNNLIRFFLIFSALLVTHLLCGTEYYCDPDSGSILNSGTFENPWKDLEEVFEAGKKFESGDIIYLRSGFHGSPVVSGFNDGYVTIRAQEGHSPKASYLRFRAAARWILSGLEISPELEGIYDNATSSQIVSIDGGSELIRVEDCYIYCAEDVYSWDSNQMLDRLGVGIRIRGENCTLINSHVRNVRFGVLVEHPAEGFLARSNLIEGIMEDGFRALANYSRYEYNIIKDFYGINDAHDDIFQSWSGGYDGIAVGQSTVYGVVLRGNIGINQTDPNNPFPDTYGVQGLGLFDGFFEDWIIENNIIVTDMWHGISFYGARNCKIVNNTVLQNPLHPLERVPWLAIYNHKNGMPSSGNLVRNNLVSRIGEEAATGNAPRMIGATLSHNIVVDNPELYFTDYSNYDFHLKADSPAIDTGTTTDASKLDIDQQLRTEPFDVGADEVSTGTPVSPPNITPIKSAHIFENMELEIAVSATDPDGDSLVLSVSGLPSFGSFNHNEGAGILSFAPVSGDAGDYRIMVTADDGILTSSRFFDLSVAVAGGSDSELAAHWSFDGDVNDISGMGNHGVIHGSPAYSTDSMEGTHSLSFNGTSDWIIVPDSDSLRITGDITLMAYVKPLGSSSVMHILSKNFNEAYRLQIRDNDGLSLIIGVPESPPHTVSVINGSASVRSEEWQHIAVTASFEGENGTIKFYHDFSLVSSHSISLSGIEDGMESLLIAGRYANTTTQLYNGLMDDVRIYKGALTEFEIASMGMESWGGFPITDDNYVNTGDWIGWLSLYQGSNWVYSYTLEGHLYLPDPGESFTGAWMYIQK